MNIRVDLNYPIKDGTEVVFRSPVDCSQVTGLKVYYDNGNSSQEFAFADAHGNNVGDIPHLFAENVAVKVILDVTTGMAFVQNADTNAYLEGRFAETIDKCCPAFAESGSVVACEPVEGYPLEVVSQISGEYMSVKLWRGGKNLLPDGWKDWSNYDANGSYAFALPPGRYIIHGSFDTTADHYVYLERSVDGGESWTVSGIGVAGANGHICAGKSTRTVVFDVTDDPNEKWCIWARAGDIPYIKALQIEVGNVVTTLEEYRGEEFTADLGEMFNGNGSYNWNTGELTDEYGTYQVSDPQEILALPGVNTLYSDTGDTTVSGRADTTAIIEKLTNAIIALGGNV